MGLGWRENADGFRAGRLAFRDVTLFDTSGQRVHRAGELDLPEQLPGGHQLTDRQVSRLDRASAMLIHAANEAVAQSGWAPQDTDKEQIPIALGTSAGAMALGEDYYKQAIATPNDSRGQASRIHVYQTQTQATHLADALGIDGPVTIITNACASGANAIGHAYQQLQAGKCQRALAGGYDALCQLVFAGFDSLQALSTDLPRPFDADRDGLALGEGAAMVALETLEYATARGANILAEVSGYGASTDVHHLTQPHPNGDAALRSMNAACADAKLNATDIGYINSHGTGTPLNDIAEGHAIQRWAGADVDKVAVSSTKACIGHLLGGAGTVEAVIALMALREGWLPPSMNVRTADPVCTFDLVQQPRDQKIRHALTNSFGFGGANATVILSEFA